MTRVQAKPVHEKVAELKQVSVSRNQKEMIENLKDLGLLNTPKFTLAYGPTAQVYQPR
ncbi:MULTISPECIES: hypothetical protein [Enterobacter]|uniref:hypothetical protein n=1 Tax=Enterobacter TaxID=547 RepID=UPI00155B05F4|nr:MULTISPECIES: hypothetical protein [Enterobacter]MCE1972577.1 hypothetical protein [Enterobacter cloacae]MCU6169084.1 hypothetical protein [Enterobacter bugandensis]HCM9361812.1 hypothetical protein [Enterobacter bugandensis]HCM9510232.1 hypothetical protein [Enterobacter bugandensis]HDS3788202.1 hypothetical protein [Enterobacter bugandensis]